MLASIFAGSSSYVMPGLAPTTAPRLSAPLMDMTDPRFPAAGKGLLPDGRTAAIPFLTTPAHLDGSYAGDNGFDPMNLGSAFNMKYLREAELKHGRICMLAFYGYVMVDLGNTWPGAPKVSSLLAHDVAVKNGSMMFLLFAVGLIESLSYVAIYEMLSGETDRKPGDLGFDPLNFAKQKDYSEVEITHCRAAMLAFGGVVTQSALFDLSFPYVNTNMNIM
mmetsp:Transcript_19075/g.38866  ORF Transcript_19075/g.38866 Transcript_19075/m.38866 type:complete len:220 (-) Transcript_19075:235-894(-)